MSSNAGIKNQLIQALVKHLTVEESFCSAQAGIQKTMPLVIGLFAEMS